MAPGRKKGANNKGKTSIEFSVGDLVLAKIKGFPAWPAKISRPEEWERTPDPKKYFVHFFGTQEIAFVAPVVIQPFTIELKKKLQTSSKGKTVKYFAQAVKEICEAFEGSEQQKYGALGDNVVSNLNVSSAVDGVVANGLDHNIEAKGEVVVDASSSGSSLEHYSNMHEGADSKKISSACGLEFSKEGPSKCNLTTTPHHKEETHDGEMKQDLSVCNERIQSTRTASVSPYSRDNPSDGLISRKRNPFISSGASSRTKLCGGKQKCLAGGYKSKASETEQKRKVADAVERDSVRITESSDSSKRKKHVDLVNVATKSSSLKNGKRDSSLDIADGKSEKNSENKGSIYVKAEDDFHSKLRKCSMPYDVPADEAVLCSLKSRHRIVLDAVLDPSEPASDDKRSSFSSSQKRGVTKKRRAICLYDDEEDDVPKTPVHGSSACKVNPSSSIPESLEANVQIQGNHSLLGHPLKCSSRSEEAPANESAPSAKSFSHSSSPVTLPEIVDKPEKVHFTGPVELDTNKQMPDSSEVESVFPKELSPHVVPAAGTNLEEQSTNGYQAKVSDTVKGLILGSTGSNYSRTQVSFKKNRQLSSGEKPKVAPKSQGQGGSALSGRLEVSRKDRSSSLEDSKTDSETSMKNLIAAAHAKRKQAQMQNLYQTNMISTFGATESVLLRNLNLSAEHQFLTGGKNLMQVDAQAIGSCTSFVSPPPGHDYWFVSQNQGIEEHDDKRHNLGHQNGNGSLSGGTEAAVARDAFEGMIETLSRTKESIGRATRLAVDCAKYGIANEVMDLLIRKLESEPSFHHKVDLFFLVDSITQCSHNQKGIAEASYVPAVQASLPRLLGAAAPTGASGQENRRQCLKVLRLWLERKIFPESVLRCYMDDIGASNDDIDSRSCFRRPTRAERAVDDPIREMEGMLDEYGSNATFQLPGFFSSRAFDVDEEDEEDRLGTSCVEVTVEHAETARGPEACMVAPSDKHHHILEDVDGELEMEDVAASQKDEVALSTTGSSEIDEHEHSVWREKNHATDADAMTPEGIPPLPLESPPPLPPLPASPPPPLPPSCPPSPPPPPPSPPAESHMPPLPTSGPSALMHLPLLPPQLSFSSHILSQPPTSLPPSPQLAYQAPGPQEFCSVPGGNQIVQMAGNAPQKSCFFPASINGLHNPSRSVEYGHDDNMYINSHPAQPNQQLRPSHTASSEGPFHSVPPPQIQTPGNQFSYNKPVIQQHLRNLHSYSSLADNQHAIWMNGGRNPACSTMFSGSEGYYQPPSERPPSNNMGSHCSAPNSAVQAGVPTPGHVNYHMLPLRPDMSALNCWKPA